MRSEYELDVYFKSSRFRKRLDFFRKKGEGFDIVGAIFIVNQFQLMQYHYGIIRHYILTGKYSPNEKNDFQFELIDYTNHKVVGFNYQSEIDFEEIDMREPQYGVHLLIPPGTRRKDLIEFVSDKDNYKKIADTLDIAYKKDPIHKHSFRPVRNIETYLEIVDRIDDNRALTPALLIDLSIEYNIDEHDIRKFYKSLGAHNNPYLRPV